jgi:protein-tyrosine phosphatase
LTAKYQIQEFGITALNIPGVINARDMLVNGHDGDQVAERNRGRYFRTSMLSKIDDQGREHLQNLGIQAIIDLRSHDENQRYGSDRDLVPSEIETFNLDEILQPPQEAKFPEPDPVQSLGVTRTPEEQRERGWRIMLQVYQRFVVSEEYQKRFALGLEIASNYDRILFHCSAGKDRTGFFAYLLKSIMEIPETEVFEDYLISAKYIEELKSFFVVHEGDDVPLVDTLLKVYPEYLQTAIGDVKSHFGDVDGYLEEIGVSQQTVAKLKKRLK